MSAKYERARPTKCVTKPNHWYVVAVNEDTSEVFVFLTEGPKYKLRRFYDDDVFKTYERAEARALEILKNRCATAERNRRNIIKMRARYRGDGQKGWI